LLRTFKEQFPYFSSLSAEKYRRTFLIVGASDLAADASTQLPSSIVAAVVESSTAQYSFDEIVNGVTVTFAIEFIKENGVWKILEY
jgi:hypothetical protein